MKKRNREKFGYFRVALCRGLGFRRIDEKEFTDAFLDICGDCGTYFMKGRYFVFIKSVSYETDLSKCTDDYLYIRKMYRK